MIGYIIKYVYFFDGGGGRLCKSEWCHTRLNKKYEGYCLLCFIHLFPDKKTSRNYKTKEENKGRKNLNIIVDYVILEYLPKQYLIYIKTAKSIKKY